MADLEERVRDDARRHAAGGPPPWEGKPDSYPVLSMKNPALGYVRGNIEVVSAKAARLLDHARRELDG